MKLTVKTTILWVVAKITVGNLNVVYLGHVLVLKKFAMAPLNVQMLAMKCFVRTITKVNINNVTNNRNIFIKKKTYCVAPGTPSCGVGLFPCDGSRCIPASRRCNQHKDCYDGTDEENCDTMNNTLSIQVSFNIDLFQVMLYFVNIF